MKILVTGVTGTVGGHVLRYLTGQGHEVRALVRDRTRADLPAEVEVVQGDLTDVEDIGRALDGVDRAFLNMADDNGEAFATAAARAGVEHVVLLSSFSTIIELPSGENNVIRARHQAGERFLTDAGVPSTFLRGAGFDHNILQWTSAIGQGVVRAPFVDVALPKVDPADIGASAAAVLTDPSPSPGGYVITGPERITTSEEVQMLGEVLGQDLRVEELSAEEAMGYFPDGQPDFVRTSVLETLGFGKTASYLLPTSDVQRLIGRPARTFRDWAKENKEAF